MQKRKGPQRIQVRVVFRPWITLRNGKRIYASSYGLKAFRLEIKD